MLDRLAFRHLQLVHDGAQALAGEDAQKRIVERQVEARGTGIALTTGTAAQLVVDATGLVTLGADDVQTTGSQHLFMHSLPFFAQGGDLGGLVGVAQRLVLLDGIDGFLDAAAKHDVGTTTGHIGGDGDHARTTSLGHDFGFTGMLLGVEHLMRQLFLVEQTRQQFGGFDRGRADQHRLAALGAVLDIGNDRRMLLVGGLEDEVVHVLAHHRAVCRDDDCFQTVDLLEFVGFGIGRAGHAGQAVVHAEVVLEGDRGQRLVLGLNLHPFLGLDGLMQTIGPTATSHQAAGEFVDDDHFAILHDVLLVLVEQRQRAQCSVEVVHQRDVGGFVEAAAVRQQAMFAQQLFGVLVTGLGEVNLMALFIDPVVAFGIFFGSTHQLGHDVLHADVEIGVIVGLTGNDQRRPRFIDEDGVHFIDDGEV